MPSSWPPAATTARKSHAHALYAWNARTCDVRRRVGRCLGAASALLGCCLGAAWVRLWRSS
eukprot:6423171-Lingulodinium_polyedra.AAC.1